jgi:hypothetical protein
MSLPLFNATGTGVNVHWTRQNHIQGVYADYNPQNEYLHREEYATSGFEADSDEIAYCDWMYEAGMPAQSTYDKVMAFTTESCLDMDYVSCSVSGDVIELRLSSRGLKGALPASFSSFTALKKLYLSYNGFTGTLPPFVWASGALETLAVTKNRFTGTIPCPSHAEPQFKSLYLARNDFTGDLPSCLFTSLPILQSLDISYLKLTNAAIPPAFANIGHSFVNIFAEHAGLAGPLPNELACMKKIIYFHLGRNAITSFPQYAIDRMSALYSIDLSYNELSGPMMHFDNSSELRRIYLEHNHISGDFSSQLTLFAQYQDAGALSAAHLSYNDLSGPLPPVLYNLKTNAHRLTTVDVIGNHFRCEGDTGTFPDWAMRLGATASFGVCAPVPTITSAGPESAVLPGGLLNIYGTDFSASAELKCKVGSLPPAPASFISSSQVTCQLPLNIGVGGATHTITVANYGTDYYSEVTHPATYAPVTVTVFIIPSPPPPPPNIIINEYGLDTGAIAGIVVACLIVLVACCVCLSVVICKERAGEPIFKEVSSVGAVVVQPPSTEMAGATSATTSVTEDKAEDKI